MSGKKCRRELLRVLVLSALLSTSYFGVAEASYVLNGDTIGGTHELGAFDQFYVLDGDRNVTALSDVSIISKGESNWPIIDGRDNANSSLDWDMNGHSLAIDAKANGIRIDKSNTNVNIHNADNIEETVDRHNFVAIANGTGSAVNFQANNNITFNKFDTSEYNPILAVIDDNQLSMKAGNDIVFNNYSKGNMITVDEGPDFDEGGKLQMNAGHDITFNQSYSDPRFASSLSLLSLQDYSDTTITAGNDINFNRYKYNPFIDLYRYAKAVITAKGNINFREQASSASSTLYATTLQNNSNLTLEALAITGNMQQMVNAHDTSQVLVKAHEIYWDAQGEDVSELAAEYPAVTSTIVSDNGSKVELQVDKDIHVSVGVPDTLLYAYGWGGNITLNASNSIYLHSGGQTDYASLATIRALDGTVDLTAGGTITVDSEGKTAAYTEFSGNIDFNGKTVISGAGIGAWSTTDSKIGMNPYGEETSKITFNDFVTMDPVNIGAKAQYNGDIIFNKGFAIDAEENAFYADSAGRIQALATGEDKVIKGNMLARNGQIDVLFDTANSSFTGTTEVQNVETIYPIKDQEDYGDDEEYGDEEETYDDEYVDVDTSASDGEGYDDSDEEEPEYPPVEETPHINIALKNGAVWNVTGDSTLTNLANDSFVNLSDANRIGTSLTAQTLSGTGTMVMDLDWNSNGGAKEKTDNSDYLNVTESATGAQALVTDKASMHLDAMGVDDRLYFATLVNSDAVFTSPITQRNVQKGHLYDYIIGIDSETTATTDDTSDAAETIADRAAADTTTDWFFGTVGYTESPVVETGRINSQIMYDLVTDVDTLNKRMGDVRHMNTDPDGWWARTTYTHQDRDSYSGHSNRFELGKDFVMNRADGSTVHQGAVFTYLRGKDSFTTGNGKYNRYSGALYHTWLGNDGRYVDVVGRIGKVMGNSHTFLVNGDQSDSSFGTWYQQASVETGRSYDLKDGWYFEPQAQLQYTHMNSKSYTSSDGINHDLDSVNSFIGRLGFRLGQKVNEKTSWYLKGDILHEFSGDGGMILTSANGLERIDYNRDGKDTWYDLGAGLTTELSPASSLWFEFERKFSGTYNNDWEFNGGIAWKF